MKFSDIDWDKDLDDEVSRLEKASSDDVEGSTADTSLPDTPLGSQGKKPEIKVGQWL